MKSLQEFLLQLIVNLIVPLLFPSGAISLLVVFKEKLPSLLFDVFIWLFWLLVIVVIARFIFGDSIKQMIRYLNQRLNRRNTTKFLREWHNNFLSLGDIVSNIVNPNGNWKKPNEEQTQEYSRLQTWFRDSRHKFIPMWRSFEYDRPANSYKPDTNDLERKIIYQKTDPFSCFYEPISLKFLEPMIHHEFGLYHDKEINYVLIKLNELTAELIEWEKTRYH